MTRRMASSTVTAIVLLAVCAVPGVGQQKLGDFVGDGGYDWIIGKWVAVGDDGKVELEYKWGLDKHIVLAELKAGDYKYSGIVMLDSDRGAVIEAGADNKGGIVKGEWTEDYGDLVYRLQHTGTSGSVTKLQVVCSKVDGDSVTIAMYGVDSSGYRKSEPTNKLTYKRQPAVAATVPAASGQTAQSFDHQTLGDLVSQAGYEWMAGKWLATDGDQRYELEHKWSLDKHVVVMDLKMGDFSYHGMVMLNPAWQEIFQVGADNQGGLWKGAWDQSYEGITHRVEYTQPYGAVRRMEHVYVPDNDDAFKVKEYSVTSGSRASEPGLTLTFNRQKTPAGGK